MSQPLLATIRLRLFDALYTNDVFLFEPSHYVMSGDALPTSEQCFGKGIFDVCLFVPRMSPTNAHRVVGGDWVVRLRDPRSIFDWENFLHADDTVSRSRAWLFTVDLSEKEKNASLIQESADSRRQLFSKTFQSAGQLINLTQLDGKAQWNLRL